MNITANDLDSNIKEEVRGVIFNRLINVYKTLPVAGEEDKIKDILVGPVIMSCERVIKDYYRVFAERDVIKVDISVDEYVKIYLHHM